MAQAIPDPEMAVVERTERKSRSPAAAFCLAAQYENGQGEPQDYTRAAQLYREAAIQGHVRAQSRMGCCYHLGRGVRQSDAEAAKWMTMAAEQNDAEAQFGLGYLHRQGLGVPQDYARAAGWYRKAAEQGFAAAQSNLAGLYRNGLGVEKNLEEARKWYALAAAQGDADAAFLAGLIQRSQRLLGMMEAITAADRSILVAVVGRRVGGDEHKLTTTRQSFNDHLWSEMSKLGWMIETPPAFDLPEGMLRLVPLACFLVSATGYANIASLLKLA